MLDLRRGELSRGDVLGPLAHQAIRSRKVALRNRIIGVLDALSRIDRVDSRRLLGVDRRNETRRRRAGNRARKPECGIFSREGLRIRRIGARRVVLLELLRPASLLRPARARRGDGTCRTLRGPTSLLGQLAWLGYAGHAPSRAGIAERGGLHRGTGEGETWVTAKCDRKP